MLKLIGPTIAKIMLAVFGVAVFALMIMLTFGSLGRIFPNDLTKQAAGLILFDIGAIVWMVIFVSASRGMVQRAIALLLFVFSTLGTVVMAGADALMSGQAFVQVPLWIGQAVVYVFIVATAVHLISLYVHHLNDPETVTKIRTQAHEDRLVEEAINLTEQKLEEQRRELSELLSQRYLKNAMTALDLVQLPGGGVIDGKVKVREIGPAEPADTVLITPNPTTPKSGRK